MNPIWTDDISTAEQIKENSVHIMAWYITYIWQKKLHFVHWQILIWHNDNKTKLGNV